MKIKKGVRIAAIAVGSLLVLMLVLPFAFKDKIAGIIQKQADKNLNATTRFEGLSLNLFTNFPNITASLNDFRIVGVDSFATDTLVQASSVKLTINLSSLFTDNGLSIRKVILKDASVHLKCLASGKGNWDIMKTDSTENQAATTDTSAMHFELKKVILDNAKVVYEDKMRDMLAVCEGWDGTLSGDLSSKTTVIETHSVIHSLSYTAMGMPVLSGAHLETDLEMDADLDKFVFTFKTNSIRLNDMELGFGGSIGMPGNDIALDLKAQTDKVTFKQLLSLVPALYTKDFESVKAAGKLQMGFYMKGLMTDTEWPSFGFKLNVENASFQYPALPKSVDNIQIACTISNPGGSLDKTIVDLSKFSLNMAGNPVSMALRVATPVSDPEIKAGVLGKLNLGVIKEFYPLEEGMHLQGILDAALSFAGRQSWVTTGQYDRFQFKGSLLAKGILLKSKDMPDVNVQVASMDFAPKQVRLSDLSVLIGKNDLHATGSIQNMLGWFMHNQLLSGSLNIQSNRLNLNDFMTGQTTTAADTSSTSMTAFQIPENLDLSLNATGKSIVFSKLELTNARAAMTVSKGRLNIGTLTANALGGSIGMNGYYEAKNIEKPQVAFGFDLKDVSFAKTFTTFDFVRKLAPVFEHTEGTYSMNLDFATSLDKHLNPNLGVLNGKGGLHSKGLKVSNLKVLDVLATTLKKENLRTLAPKDLNLSFTISDGKVKVAPFKIKVEGIELEMGGTTSLDQKIDYQLAVALPQNLSLVGVTGFKGTIGGTFQKPVIKLNAGDIAKQAVTTLADKALKSTLGVSTDEAKAKAKEELEKNAAKLREQAQKAGDQLIEEAEARGNQLVANAKNPLLKAAAKVSADQLVKEARKKAAALSAEAENQISKLSEGKMN